MPSERLQSIVAASSIYRGLGPDAMRRVLEGSRLVTESAGQLLFDCTQPCPGVYVVGTGKIRLTRTAPGGKTHVLRFVDARGSFGEAAVIGNFPAPVSAVAHTDVECAMFPAADFRELIQLDHALCLEIMASMTGRVHHLVDLLEDLILRDAVERVARHLHSQGEDAQDGWLTLPVRKQDLATHLGLTSETFSRTLRRLVEAGAIEVTAARVRLTQQDLLRDIANGAAPARASAG